MIHSANQLRFIADILGPDSTLRASGIRVGQEMLSGKRLEQAQLIASETSHMLLFRANDAVTLDESCYVVIDGVTYIVDYKNAVNDPRPGMWLEVFAHIENGGQANGATGVTPAQTFKQYVDTQDAATLAAAEAYTDAHSGGGDTVVHLTTSTLLTAVQNVAWCNGTFTVTLPLTPDPKVHYTIVIESGTVTLIPSSGTGTIGGFSSIAGTVGSSFGLRHDGTNWEIV